MCDKNDNGEDAKLSNGTTCEDGNDTKDSIASNHLESIGGPCDAHAFADTFFDWQRDRSGHDFIDLE